jgi:hypothetical protein
MGVYTKCSIYLLGKNKLQNLIFMSPCVYGCVHYIAPCVYGEYAKAKIALYCPFKKEENWEKKG